MWELLRKYFAAGKLKTPIATRDVRDEFVEMSESERTVYDAIEDYISTTYNQAAENQRNAVGFIMTIYRKRVASSFSALTSTLTRRLQALDSHQSTLEIDDIPEDDFVDEALEADDVEELDRQALVAEERESIRWTPKRLSLARCSTGLKQMDIVRPWCSLNTLTPWISYENIYQVSAGITSCVSRAGVVS